MMAGLTTSSVSFHPTMVLAQPAQHPDGTVQVHVSIPLWFSLNVSSSLAYPTMNCFHPTMVLAQPDTTGDKRLVITRFHPTMVLAQHSVVPKNTMVETGFHPTMVLAQPGRTKLINWNRVSIPLWFSLNVGTVTILEEEYLVSIPLWFSLNMTLEEIAQSILTFPSHYGSRSTRQAGRVLNNDYPVSIPLWFSLNGRPRESMEV